LTAKRTISKSRRIKGKHGSRYGLIWVLYGKNGDFNRKNGIFDGENGAFLMILIGKCFFFFDDFDRKMGFF
jgi:hypothetical protein